MEIKIKFRKKVEGCKKEETYNLPRFVKEPNELGKSPVKLLYERSLMKGKSSFVRFQTKI